MGPFPDVSHAKVCAASIEGFQEPRLCDASQDLHVPACHEDYVIAGKTGTAQIPLNGKYDPNKTNATFVGYLGKSKKFSMIVRLDRPSSSVYAAETAVPLWMSVASDLVSLFGIPPDKH